jgi:hypothetical protein
MCYTGQASRKRWRNVTIAPAAEIGITSGLWRVSFPVLRISFCIFAIVTKTGVKAIPGYLFFC